MALIRTTLDPKAQYGFAARDARAQGLPVTKTYEQATQGILAPKTGLNSPGIGSAGQTLPIKPGILTLPKNNLNQNLLNTGQPTTTTNAVNTGQPTTTVNLSAEQQQQQSAENYKRLQQQYQDMLNQSVANGTQQNQQSNQPAPTPAPTTPPPTPFGGMVQGLVGLSQQDSPEVLAERQRLQNLRDEYAKRTGGLERSGAGMSIIGGEEGIMARQQAAQEGVISQNLASAIATQQQRAGILGSAAGLAKPITGVPYGTQTIDPSTGLPMGGGGGGSMDPAASIPSLVDQVISGQMSIDQANSALGGNIGLTTALRNSILQKNPNFNFIESNARAAAQAAATQQTGTIGGELTKQADTVKQHMLTLQSAYDQLGSSFGIPLLNQGVNYIKEKFGSGPLQSYDIALQNVRDELAKILGGGTSTEGSRATAKSLLPDNMTPAQIESSIRTATELMNSKIQEYTKTPTFGGGQAGGTSTGAGIIKTPYGNIDPNL